MTFKPFPMLVLTALLSPAALHAADMVPQTQDVKPNPQSYSPFIGESYPKNVYWGDTHLHTSNSFDAGFVNFRVDPEGAFRFARGEQVLASGGFEAKLVRPLDFLVVSDHAEYLGLTPGLRRSDPLLLETEYGRRWHDMLQSGVYDQIFQAAMEAIRSIADADEKIKNEDFTRSTWEDTARIADRYNQPGVFTAFIGYEWTSQPAGNNLHRVVIFKEDADRATQRVCSRPWSARKPTPPPARG